MSHERENPSPPELDQPQDENPSIMDRPVSRRSVLKGIAGAFGAAVVNSFPLSEVSAAPNEEDSRELSDQEHSEALPQAEGLTGIEPFDKVWARTDELVANGTVSRTWMWGPEAFDIREEPYAESPGGKRLVAYFDKSRMEITYPEGDPDSDWYVTNGLLVNELITGRMQTGDNSFVDRTPADIQVVGDPDAGNLTYATLAKLLPDQEQRERGTSLIERVNREGEVSIDPTTGTYNVKLSGEYVPETGHQVAQPFYEFMTSEGPTIDKNGNVIEDGLILPTTFYATGYPTTDPYWFKAIVAGKEQDVLVQAFERRVLTYNPANNEGWKVEAGNVGRHYHEWRGNEIEPGCGVVGRETIGNLNDGQGVMIVNKECSRYWFENGEDPSNDITELDTAMERLHPGEGWRYILHPTKDTIPPKKASPEVGVVDTYNQEFWFDSNIYPGLGPGFKSIIYKGEGIFEINEALPDNLIEYLAAVDEETRARLIDSVSIQPIISVLINSDARGGSLTKVRDVTREEGQKILASPTRPLQFKVA